MSDAQPLASSIGHLTGQVIGGRYRLGGQLGQGGMGVVYAAVQESLARPVALKVLQPVLAQDGESILRFKAEAERAGRLAHPHIVQILDFGHEPNASAWIAMELLRGESLGARIERGSVSEAEVVRIARETLSALEAAHAAHLVHRDLKPDNIFLAQVPGIGTSVKVLDFGIAKLLDGDAASKLTATGMLIGTPLYMAPEQARGDDVDQRADLYALGAVLYEALTGRPPFTGRNYNALLFSVLHESPMPIETYRPDISEPLARVIARAMAKLPSERWQSAHDMAEALHAIQPSEHLPVMRAMDTAAMGSAPTMATPAPHPGAGSPMATAPTMATPAPHPGAATPILGGSSTGVTSSPPTQASASPPAQANASPPAHADASSPTHASPSPATGHLAPVASAQPFRWWPIALAGGVLAVATFAFLGGKMTSSTDTASAVATAAPLAETATLVPITPAQPPMPATVAVQRPDAGDSSTIAQRADEARPSDAPLADRETIVTRRSAAAPARPVRRSYPRPFVGYSGGAYGGLPDSSAMRGPIEAEGGWADCWPRDLPAPDVNRGRDFLIDVAPAGRVLSAQAAPNNEEPRAFSSCVVNKLRRLDFGPTVAGDVAHIRVSLRVESR